MPRPPAGHRRIWSQALQQWSTPQVLRLAAVAKHRTDGRPSRETSSDTGGLRDDESARGIRRRLQKRANAGDEQQRQHGRPLTPGPFNASRAFNASQASLRARGRGGNSPGPRGELRPWASLKAGEQASLKASHKASEQASLKASGCWATTAWLISLSSRGPPGGPERPPGGPAAGPQQASGPSTARRAQNASHRPHRSPYRGPPRHKAPQRALGQPLRGLKQPLGGMGPERPPTPHRGS